MVHLAETRVVVFGLFGRVVCLSATSIWLGLWGKDFLFTMVTTEQVITPRSELVPWYNSMCLRRLFRVYSGNRWRSQVNRDKN